MKIITTLGNVQSIGMIEDGCLFKYHYTYYIATDDNDKENRRICVNIESGEVEALPTGIVVEAFYNATIDLLGRG